MFWRPDLHRALWSPLKTSRELFSAFTGKYASPLLRFDEAIDKVYRHLLDWGCSRLLQLVIPSLQPVKSKENAPSTWNSYSWSDEYSSFLWIFNTSNVFHNVGGYLRIWMRSEAQIWTDQNIRHTTEFWTPNHCTKERIQVVKVHVLCVKQCTNFSPVAFFEKNWNIPLRKDLLKHYTCVSAVGIAEVQGINEPNEQKAGFSKIVISIQYPISIYHNDHEGKWGTFLFSSTALYDDLHPKFSKAVFDGVYWNPSKHSKKSPHMTLPGTAWVSESWHPSYLPVVVMLVRYPQEPWHQTKQMIQF